MRSTSQVSVSHIIFKDFRNSVQETSLKGNASFPSQKRKKPRNFQLCFATFMHFPRGSRLLGKKQLSLSWRRELRADNLEEQRNYTSEVVRQLTQQGFPYRPTLGQIQKDLPCFWVWLAGFTGNCSLDQTPTENQGLAFHPSFQATHQPHHHKPGLIRGPFQTNLPTHKHCEPSTKLILENQACLFLGIKKISL